MRLSEVCGTEVSGGVRSGRLGRDGEANLGSTEADSVTEDSVAFVASSDDFGGEVDVGDDDVEAGDDTAVGNDVIVVSLPLAEESFASCSSS